MQSSRPVKISYFYVRLINYFHGLAADGTSGTTHNGPNFFLQVCVEKIPPKGIYLSNLYPITRHISTCAIKRILLFHL